MTIRKTFALFAAALAVAATVAAPAAQAVPTEKKLELLLSAQGTNNNDFDTGSFGGQAQLGYYLSDQLELVGRQSFLYSDGEDISSSFDGSSRVGVFYNFNGSDEQMVVPFVGATVGYKYGDNTDDEFIGSPEAGVKFFVNDTTFVQLSAAYDFDFGDFDEGQFNYTLGIGFTFGG